MTHSGLHASDAFLFAAEKPFHSVCQGSMISWRLQNQKRGDPRIAQQHVQSTRDNHLTRVPSTHGIDVTVVVLVFFLFFF